MADKSPITNEQRYAARKKLAIIGGVVVFFLLANFFYQIWRHHHAKPTLSQQSKCDLHKAPCRVTLPNNQAITFAISPKSIPTNQTITMSVKLENLDAKKVAIYLLALKTKEQNKRIDLTTTDGVHYEGTTLLHHTENPGQEWMAMVAIKTDKETIGVPFKFIP